MVYRFLLAVLISSLLGYFCSAGSVRAESEDSESLADDERAETQSGSKADQKSDAVSDEQSDESAEEPAPVKRLPRSHKRAAVMSNEAGRMTALAAEIAVGEAVWLGTGEDRFFALFRPESTGYPQGGMILIHNNGENPAQPGAIQGIRSWLPNYGWSTLAISVPDLQQASLPARTRPGYVRWERNDDDTATGQSADQETADTKSNVDGKMDPDSKPDPETQTDLDQDSKSAADAALARPAAKTDQIPPDETEQQEEGRVIDLAAANRDSLDSLFKTLDRRISTSIQYMQESKGQYNLILLGVGNGAHLLARYAQTQVLAGNGAVIQGLVFVNAGQYLQSGLESLPNLLANLYMPILDLYQNNSVSNIESAKKRIDQANRYHLTRYTQVRIPAVSNQAYSRNNRMIRRVTGWLAKYAEGMEVQK